LPKIKHIGSLPNFFGPSQIFGLARLLIYLITDAIVSIEDTRLRLPTEIFLKAMQAVMQFELYCEWLGQAPPPDVGGPRHFCFWTT